MGTGSLTIHFVSGFLYSPQSKFSRMEQRCRWAAPDTGQPCNTQDSAGCCNISCSSLTSHCWNHDYFCVPQQRWCLGMLPWSLSPPPSNYTTGMQLKILADSTGIQHNVRGWLQSLCKNVISYRWPPSKKIPVEGESTNPLWMEVRHVAAGIRSYSIIYFKWRLLLHFQNSFQYPN